MATSRTIICLGGAARPARSRGRAGGFTLIEILVVLAIVAALMALVSPPLIRWVGEYRFRETLSQVEAAMVRVRADSQTNGNAIEVVARRVGNSVRLVGREIDLGNSAPAPERGAHEESAGRERVVFEFPAGFIVCGTEPAADAPKAESEGMAPPPAIGSGDTPAPAQVEDPGSVVVIFLPDGSAARGTGSGLVSDRSGRRAQLKVNTWTGKVELAPAAAPDAIATRSGTRGDRSKRTQRARGARWGERRRGALLLETMVALAIFVAGGLAVMAMVNRAAASMAMARDYRGAADLARSTMAKIEAGIATPQTLNGPVAAWDPGEETGEEAGTEIGSGFNDAPLPPSPWELEVSTEPTSFDGLTLVTVKAMRRAGEASERTRASYTLRQLVRLGGAGGESVGEQDPMAESAKPGRSGGGSKREGGPP